MTVEVPNLRELQDRYGAPLDCEIERWFSLIERQDAFVGMMRYQMGYVDETFAPSSHGAGKRFRPLLLLAVCEAAGGSWSKALPVAAGVELLHNFSLVHDDIEDRDPARRHRATVWKVWGEAQAINAGDGMFALASRAVAAANVPAAAALDLVTGFQEMALDLTRGQYQDMSFETRGNVTADEYLDMIGGKTAAIISYSSWAGGCIAEAHADAQAALRSFGHNLGKAFQIQDDILGIWGVRERTGKEVASDLRNGKKTLPVLLALDHATGDARETVRRYVSGETYDPSAVAQAIDTTSARGMSLHVVQSYRDVALTALDHAHLSEQSRQELCALAEDITRS